MAKSSVARVERQLSSRYERTAETILTAAGDLFLSDGYDISLDEVAARAGLSRATLYNHYSSKKAVLEAVVRRMGERFMQDLVFREDATLQDVLEQFAREYEKQCLGRKGHQFYKLFVSDVSRFPDLAAAVYSATVTHVETALAAQLRRLMETGAIKPVDPTRMAERFFGALTGDARHKASAGMKETAEERALFIAETVQLFVDALRPTETSRP